MVPKVHQPKKMASSLFPAVRSKEERPQGGSVARSSRQVLDGTKVTCTFEEEGDEESEYLFRAQSKPLVGFEEGYDGDLAGGTL